MTLLMMPLSLGLALVLGGILVAGVTARRRLGLVTVGLGGCLIWVAALPKDAPDYEQPGTGWRIVHDPDEKITVFCH